MVTKAILGVEQEEQRATRELYSQSSPQQLVASVLQGDTDAFGAITEQFGTYMLHMARLIVGDYESAQDVLQEALIRAWRYLPDLHEAGALHSWLMRIVVNQSLHLKRQRVSSTALSHRIVDEYKWDAVVQFSDETKGSREQYWDLKQAVEQLPDKQRVIVVLHYYYGMTFPEMAQTLETSQNTLKKRLQAALINLRRSMNRE